MICKYTQLVPEDMIVFPVSQCRLLRPFAIWTCLYLRVCLLSRRRTGNCRMQSTAFQTNNCSVRGAAWKIECRLETRYCTETV